MKRWTTNAANEWWQNQKWPVGFNYVTSDAVNDIEMWMDATFNEALIKKELEIAHNIGFNSVRVFLSYTVWFNEGERFLENFEKFLKAANDLNLTVMPILFDDCAFDFGNDPVYGPQPEPIYGVHNSRWVPSPGFAAQDDPTQTRSLENYVKTVIGSHKDDKRILVWDLYNEPGNSKRFEKALPLLQNVFEWARACCPVQPLTAGAWNFSNNQIVEEYCFSESDVISIHAYTPIEKTLEILSLSEKEGRPILITEWLHRPNKNTIEDHLPLFFEKKIGAWQWGMIQNRTQTNLNWSTMNGGTPDPEPEIWQHDILYPNGQPYRESEVSLITEFASK